MYSVKLLFTKYSWPDNFTEIYNNLLATGKITANPNKRYMISKNNRVFQLKRNSSIVFDMWTRIIITLHSTLIIYLDWFYNKKIEMPKNAIAVWESKVYCNRLITKKSRTTNRISSAFWYQYSNFDYTIILLSRRVLFFFVLPIFLILLEL